MFFSFDLCFYIRKRVHNRKKGPTVLTNQPPKQSGRVFKKPQNKAEKHANNNC